MVEGERKIIFIVPQSPAHSVVVKGTGLAVMGRSPNQARPQADKTREGDGT